MSIVARFVIPVCIILACTGARGQDSAALGKVVSSGVCPRDLSKYNLLSFKDRCENPNDGRHRAFDENAAIGRCQGKVTRDNEAIAKYNMFVERCASLKSGSNGAGAGRPPSRAAAPERTFSESEVKAASSRCMTESMGAASSADPHHKRKWDQAELNCYRRMGMGGLPEAKRIAKNLGDGSTDAYDRRMDAIGRAAGSGGGGGPDVADFGNSVASAIRARNGGGSGCRYNVGSKEHPRYTNC